MPNIIKGKLCHFTRKDIRKIDKNFDLYRLEEMKLYDLLEEHMLDNGFVVYDEDIEFSKEIVYGGWHWRRYNCFVLKGKRRNGRFILSEAMVQYSHIN